MLSAANHMSAANLSGTFTLCMLGNFAYFFVVCCFFLYNYRFQKILSGTPSKCQTVWIQIRPNVLSVEPDLGQNCLQRSSANDTSGQRVKILHVIHLLK